MEEMVMLEETTEKEGTELVESTECSGFGPIALLGFGAALTVGAFALGKLTRKVCDTVFAGSKAKRTAKMIKKLEDQGCIVVRPEEVQETAAAVEDEE